MTNKRRPKTLAMPIRASPYAHQRAAFDMALNLFGVSGDMRSSGMALLADMGTGKSLTAIAITGALYQAGRIHRTLIVAPLSILGVWQEEFDKFAGFPFVLNVLSGTAAKKTETLRAMTGSTLQAAVVNYESAWRLEREIIAWKPDLIIADEGHKIKTHNAHASKAMHRIGGKAAYRLLLTGTPITNKALGLFSQYKFLNPAIFGGNFYAFRNRYFDMMGYGLYTPVLKKHMEPELQERMHSVAFVARKADCLDLPETTDTIRYVDLEPKAARVYRDLVRESIASLDKGEVTVTNVLTRLLRLSQLTGGFLTDDADGMPQQVSSTKLDALEDILDSTLEEGRKLVVVARFVPEINAICKLLDKHSAAYSLIKGGVADRSGQVSRFQNDPNCMVFVGQIATAGMGITLTAASLMVFFSLDYSMSNFQQARARIHRVGQRENCQYVYLAARGTVDEKVLKALRDKTDLAKSFIDDYHKGANPFQP